MPLTHPTELPEENGKGNVPAEPDPDPSFSDSSSEKKKRDNKKKRQKYRKDDSSDISLSENYDSSDDSDYIHKKCKRKSDRKN